MARRHTAGKAAQDTPWLVFSPVATGADISGVVVVHNEEAVITRCLESLEGVVDEVIVVHDGPCSDATLAIARNRGCRVFERPRVGHAEYHRPFAYEQAQCEWILNLDGDEFLSETLRQRLGELAGREGVAAFEFEWPMWDGERYITSGGPFESASTPRRLGGGGSSIITDTGVHGLRLQSPRSAVRRPTTTSRSR